MGFIRHPRRVVALLTTALLCAIAVINFDNFLDSQNNVAEVLLANTQDSQKTIQKKSTARRNHLVYVKIEKTGSSTMSNILAQYGMVHGLNMMMSTLKQNYINTRELEPGTTWIIGPNTTAPLRGELMEQHGRFKEELYDKYFPKDTVYISSLREPVSWFISYVDFMSAYRKWNPRQVLHNDKLFHMKRTFLIGMPKHVHNCFMQWLGFDPDKSGDEQTLLDFIKYVDSKFELMLITEYFDESLILLRRMMNWSFNDIFYAYANEGKRKSGIIFAEDEKRKVIDKDHNRGDYLLYQHFNNSFWEKVKASPDFWEEVALFRKQNAQAHRFCNSPESLGDRKLTLKLYSRWEGDFTVTDFDCLKLRLINGAAPALSDALDAYIPARRQLQAGAVWQLIKQEKGYTY